MAVFESHHDGSHQSEESNAVISESCTGAVTMYGRYVRRATKKAIADWFGVRPEHLSEFG
jgi:hypothetical protein